MIGERVRLAREASLLTQHALADAAGVSQSTISDIECGRISAPADDVIERVSRATSFPVSFFQRGVLPDMPNGHYRRLKRGTAQVSKQIRAQVRLIVELVENAEQVLKLPKVAIEPTTDLAEMRDIERVVADVRDRLGVDDLGPIPNLTRAVERAGVVVVNLAGDMPDHDGFSTWPDAGLGGRPVIALASGAPGDRARFNTAHELGHLVLHTDRPATPSDRAEKEAHRFAGALLLPKAAAKHALRPPVTLRILMNVKASYGISIAAGAKRAHDLQLIDHNHFVSLRKQISARRWTKSEPIEVATESPQLIREMLDFLAGDGSTLDRAARLGMPVFSLRALTAARGACGVSCGP